MSFMFVTSFAKGGAELPLQPALQVAPPPGQNSSSFSLALPSITATDWKARLTELIDGDASEQRLRLIPRDICLNMGFFPIVYAMRQNKVRVALDLMRMGFAVSEEAAFLAIRESSRELLQKYLETKSANRPIPKNWLSDAAFYCSSDAVVLLLMHGAEDDGQAVACAAASNNFDKVRLLVYRGHPISVEAMEWAKTEEMAYFLLKHSAPVRDSTIKRAIIMDWNTLLAPLQARGARIPAGALGKAIEHNNQFAIDMILRLDNPPLNAKALIAAVGKKKHAAH